MGKRHIASHRTRQIMSAISLLWALLACERKQTPSAPAPKPGAALPEAATPSTASALPKPQNLSEPELRALLERWLSAQNQGNYEAYAALYAQKFFGVKRAGRRTTQFARAGWLEDRKRMFQKPMTVEAKEPRFRAGSSSAEIEFTQRFASGTFADEGPKRLLVVREAGTLKLAHEEMLRSRETARPSPNLNTEFDLHFVLTLESGLYVVLEPSTELKGRGPARFEREPNSQDPDILTTTRALGAEPLAPELAAWKGATMRLDTGCSAKLGKFMLVSRVDPHFGTEQQWHNTYDDQPRALTDQEINDAAFELGQPALIARLDGCTEGSFAQRASTPPPVLGERVEDPELSARARAAFAKLREVKQDQADFMSSVEGAQGAWWSSTLRIEIYRHPTSRQTLVLAHAFLEGDSCADYSVREWAFFEVRGKQLVHLRTLSTRAEVQQVLDVNGDGRLEFVLDPLEFGHDLELVSPDEGGPSVELSYSYQDCPC